MKPGRDWSGEWMEGRRLGMPERAILAYIAQANGAQRRGIEFLFSVSEWWAWWQTDGRWERRGRGRDQLAMGRRNDVGPYSPSNVYPTTNAENVRESATRPGRRRGKGGLEHPDKARSHHAAVLAINLRARRRALGISMTELSERTGVRVASLHQMERGIANPRIDMVGRLARALGVMAWELYAPPSVKA